MRQSFLPRCPLNHKGLTHLLLAYWRLTVGDVLLRPGVRHRPLATRYVTTFQAQPDSYIPPRHGLKAAFVLGCNDRKVIGQGFRFGVGKDSLEIRLLSPKGDNLFWVLQVVG